VNESLPPSQNGYDLGLPKGAFAGGAPAFVVAMGKREKLLF